jgi:exonuclease III
VFRLLTYNVLEGAASGRLDGVLQAVESARAEVVAIQEARYWRRHRRETLREASRRLGVRGLLAEANSGFDLVVFSRLPVLRFTNHGAESPFLHTACSLDLRAPSGAVVTLFVAHLRPDLPGRGHEVKLLLEWMRPYRSGYCALCGDLNSLTPGDPVASGLWAGSPLGQRSDPVIPRIARAGWRDCFRLLHRTRPGFTLGTKRRVARVDYIFASPKLAARVARCQVHRHPGLLAASDHSPVWAEFDV